jgi:hypothetical protein
VTCLNYGTNRVSSPISDLTFQLPEILISEEELPALPIFHKLQKLHCTEGMGDAMAVNQNPEQIARDHIDDLLGQAG